MRSSLISVLAAALLLSACGGGGGNSLDAPGPAAAQATPLSELRLKRFQTGCSDWVPEVTDALTEEYLQGYACLLDAPCPVFVDVGLAEPGAPVPVGSPAEDALDMNGTVLADHHLRFDRADDASSRKKHDHKKSVFLGNLPFNVEEEAVHKFFSDGLTGGKHSVDLFLLFHPCGPMRVRRTRG